MIDVEDMEITLNGSEVEDLSMRGPLFFFFFHFLRGVPRADSRYGREFLW